MPRKAIPEERAQATQRATGRIRRRYKVQLNQRTKIRPGEKERISQIVIVLKLARYSHTQIGQIVGLSRGQVKELLEDPKVSEKLADLQRALPEAALDLLHGYTIEAVQTIAAIMRESEDDKITLQAAAEILDRAGVAKVSRTDSKVHRTTESKTTFSDDALVDRIRELPMEKQEEAAQMIEGIEAFLNTNEAKDSK